MYFKCQLFDGKGKVVEESVETFYPKATEYNA
jgi:hypothetical protein